MTAAHQQLASSSDIRRAISVVPEGQWAPDTAEATITLDFALRTKRRVQMHDDAGASVLIDLPKVTLLHDGDGLQCEDGVVIRVIAASEPLIKVTGRDPLHLARLAWHIGNRHVPAQIGADALFIHPDHVIEAMLHGLGARTVPVIMPFQPESGAYSAHMAHTHAPHFPHDHASSHGHHHG